MRNIFEKIMDTDCRIQSKKSWQFKSIVLLAFMAMGLSGHAQTLTFQKYGVSDGLSSNTVFAVGEDQEGFIWIATNEGVDRFDGVNFKRYILPERNKRGDASTAECRLLIDSRNRIWLFTLGGLLYKYDTKGDIFELFYVIDNVTERSFHTFFIDHNAIIWFGVSDGVLILNTTTKELQKLPEINSITSAIAQDKANRYYLGTDGGIIVLDSDRNFVRNLGMSNKTRIDEFDGSRISSLLIDEDRNRLWVGDNRIGLYAYNLINFELIRPTTKASFNGLRIKSMERFSENEIALAVDGRGLVIWDADKNLLKEEIKDETGPGSLSSKSAQHVFRNREGVLFIATWRGGLNVYSPGKLPFKSLKNNPFTKNSLRDNVVLMLNELTPGTLIFGTDKGLSTWDKDRNLWKDININLNGVSHISNARSMAVDRDGNIWVASYTDSLVLFKKTPKTYFSTKGFPALLKKQNFFRVYTDGQDKIWFTDQDSQHIYWYNLDTKQAGVYPISIGHVQVLSRTSTELLAMGTANGLQFLNLRTSQLEELPMVNESGLKDAVVTSLTIDTNKQLWVGTKYQGIFTLNLYQKSVNHISNESGLPSNRVFSLAATDSEVWASTARGISKIDSKNRIENFSASDGLISIDFNYDSALKDAEGQLYFGTNNGVISFDPAEIVSVKSKKTLAFDEFYLNHKRIVAGENSVLSKAFNDTEYIELSHDLNSFSIGFTSIDFLHSDQGKFQWKLENFDEDWISGQGTNLASYTNLNPGKYVFRLRMVDDLGATIAREKKILILIKPAFWNTYWAYSLYTALGILVITLLLYSNGLRIKSRHSKEKLRYLVNMAHEVKTPLMLITAPLTDLLNNNKVDNTMRQGIDIALRNANMLHKQMVQFLDFQRFDVQHKPLNVETVDIVKLLKDKLFAFSVLADKKNIDFSLAFEQKEFIVRSDQKIIDKIISNLISNAIKYTPVGGKVTVVLKVTERSCGIVVKDTGIGVPAAQQKKIFRLFYRSPNAKESGSPGSGVGLVLASDLAKILRGRVILEESSAQGSLFSFHFPYTLPQGNEKKIESGRLEKNESKPETSPLPKILLVEDNEDLIGFSKAKLEHRYKISMASNGDAALKLLKNDFHDVVVSDIVMPIMNGRQLCMNLKKNLETCHIPVILLTGLESKEHMVQGLQCGADDYIVKPYDYELLIGKIDALLQNRAILKHKFLLHSTEEVNIYLSNKLDSSFMTDITDFVEKNISDSTISPKELCEHMGMSRTSFYHKLKSLIDVSPNEFIRTVRLKKGRAMLESCHFNVSEVAYSIGFSDAKYFGTIFKKYYGESPSVFLAKKAKEKSSSTPA